MSSHEPNEARVIALRPTVAAPSSMAAPASSAAPARTPGAVKPSAADPAERHDGGSGPTRAEREPLWRHVVGDVLRRERLAQERTLREVAEAARISMPYLSELERGRKEASSEVLAAAARALGLGLGDLLGLAQGELARLERARTAGVRIGFAPFAIRPATQGGRGNRDEHSEHAERSERDSRAVSETADHGLAGSASHSVTLHASLPANSPRGELCLAA